MYYTIEGKRLLKILYLLGTLLGTIMLNIGVKSGFLHSYDFLDYTSYISTLEQTASGSLLSYVVLIRIRQLVFFILSVLLFSPYVTYCIAIFVFALLSGSFISLLVIRYGWVGLVCGGLFYFPHILCYGAMFMTVYLYIFRYRPGEYIKIKRRSFRSRLQEKTLGGGLLDSRLFAAILCIILFSGGCYCEGVINPFLLRTVIASTGWFS